MIPISHFYQIKKLALPLVVSHLAQISMSFIDTVLMGMLGVDALAGGGLAAALLQFCLIVSIGVLTAVANIVAFARGKGDHSEIRGVFHAGLLLVMLQSAMFGALLWNAAPLLLAVGQRPEVVAVAEVYLHSVVWMLLPGLSFMLLRSLVLGLGSARSVLQITLIAAALNYPISFLLMKGVGDWHGFGIAGIGYGTSLVSILMLCAFVRDILKEPKFRGYLTEISTRYLKFAQVKQTVRLGFPIALSLAMEVGLFSTAAILAGLLGPVPLAAHQIALQCISLSFMIPLGISEAASIHVGQLTGAGQGGQIWAVTRTSLFMGTVFSFIAAALFWWFPSEIVHLFLFASTEAAVEKMALENTGVQLLLVAALFQWVDGTQVILMGMLRGLKQTVGPTVVTFIGYWCVGFPFAWWAMGYWGVVGLWTGLGVGLATAALLLLWVLSIAVKRYASNSSQFMMTGTNE